jgi:enoyl-CoA hydratase
MPNFAAIDGYALGGRGALVMACDMRIEGKSGRFGQTEIKVGIIPGAGATVRLVRLVGLGKAKELVMTGKIVTAEEAYRINLINAVVDDEKLMDEAIALAQSKTRHSPVALGLAKSSVQRSRFAHCRHPGECLLLPVLCQPRPEGGDAGLLGKRKPAYHGR